MDARLRFQPDSLFGSKHERAVFVLCADVSYFTGLFAIRGNSVGEAAVLFDPGSAAIEEGQTHLRLRRLLLYAHIQSGGYLRKQDVVLIN